MQEDVYLPIAHALARPLVLHNKRRLLLLLCYQLWRVDFAALARLALVYRGAATAVRRLLWTCTTLGEREHSRRAQVERSHAFLRLPLIATHLASASWTRSSLSSSLRIHVRSRVRVAFNGRICIREYEFP
jgi:hypothetical protein